MSDDQQAPDDRPEPPTPTPVVPPAQERADALGVAVRRSLWPVFAILLVIGMQAVIQGLAVLPGGVEAGYLVVYSLMLLAMLPVIVTFGAAGIAALVTKEVLPATLLAVVAGLVTTAWVAWIATGWLGLVFGLVLGAATTGAALVLQRRRPLLVRLPLALVVAAVGGVATLAASTLTA